MNKQEILSNALTARENEVMEYQINIDNYRLAVERIDTFPEAEREELAEFRARLCDLLKSSLLEQKKAQIMLDVIKMQVV